MSEGVRLDLSAEQTAVRSGARALVEAEIAPHADRWERDEGFPPELLDRLRERGYLGAPVPEAAGGGGMEPVAYGLLTEEIGRGCSSVRSLVTVHDMSTLAVHRWGSAALREDLVPSMARGERIVAFALSEPEIGSDAANVRTEARADGERYLLSGRKTWITCGTLADLLLVFTRVDDRPAAFLVDADGPGISRRAIPGMAGTAASHVTEIDFEDAPVPKERLVGRPGFGFSAVASTALDHGRYSVAWGAVGIAQACLDATLDHTARREQFGVPLREHQLVRRKLTEMIADTRAARLLCYRAGYQREIGAPGAVAETQVAKYFASRAATRAATAAVQLHGARGLSRETSVGRFLRDARVTEIIEGSTQIQQITIPDQTLDPL